MQRMTTKMAKGWSIFFMKRRGINHFGERKAGNGEVYKTKMVGDVHAELISPNPIVLEIRDVFETFWQQE